MFENQMIISGKELKEKGLTYYKINQLVEEGIFRKLNKRYYENMNYTGETTDFSYIPAYIPQGVICLMSAAVYYDLTNYMPHSVDVAIPRKSRISTLPDWPSIDLYYYTDYRYNLGIEENNNIRIYDIEKTVVDIIYYRERMGIDTAKEVLVNYLRRKDRNLNKLIRYSDKCKCGEIMRTYLEVLI